MDPVLKISHSSCENVIWLMRIPWNASAHRESKDVCKAGGSLSREERERISIFALPLQ